MAVILNIRAIKHSSFNLYNQYNLLKFLKKKGEGLDGHQFCVL